MSKNKPLLIIFIGLISIIGFILSLNFPDLDIRIFGIGMHRFFLFHSAIIPLLLFILAKLIFKLKDYLEVMIIAFCGSFSLGIGIHLFFDVFQSKAIMFPFIGSLIDDTSLDDRIWLIVNILICLLFSFILYKRIVKLIGLKKVIVEPQTTFADLGVESNKEKKRH